MSWKTVAVDGLLLGGDRLDCRGGLRLLRIEPDVRWKTWRPALMGLGASDLRADALDLNRADLVQLRLSPTLRLGSVALILSVSQWLPIAVRDRESGGASGGSGTGGNDGGDGGDGGSAWGGFSASIQLRAGY